MNGVCPHHPNACGLCAPRSSSLQDPVFRLRLRFLVAQLDTRNQKPRSRRKKMPSRSGDSYLYQHQERSFCSRPFQCIRRPATKLPQRPYGISGISGARPRNQVYSEVQQGRPRSEEGCTGDLNGAATPWIKHGFEYRCGEATV